MACQQKQQQQQQQQQQTQQHTQQQQQLWKQQQQQLWKQLLWKMDVQFFSLGFPDEMWWNLDNFLFDIFFLHCHSYLAIF